MSRIAKLTFLPGLLAAFLSLSLTQTGCGSGSSGSANAQTTSTSAGTGSSTAGDTGATGGTTSGSTTASGATAGGTTSGSTGGSTGGGTTSGGSGNVGAGTIQEIQHIVFVLQENRSFDSYFGMLNEYQKTIKGIANPQVAALPLTVKLPDRNGVLISPFHNQTMCTDAITPAWGASIVDYDNGKMDHFMLTTPSSTIDPAGTRAMAYYDWTDLPYYYEVATEFGTSDTFFSSVGARTPVNRMYIMGASSYGNIDFGPIPSTAPTIFDRLTAAGISWKYYYEPTIPKGTLNILAWNTSKTAPQNIVPSTEYFSDLQNGTLPQVSFIERDNSGLDEHPTNNIQVGAASMATEINALMSSSAWPTSVLLLGYDEGGGLYDHVPPLTVPAPDNIPPNLSEDPGHKVGTFTRSGFRVPLMVISPWVKPRYVSHVPRDSTSFLKFIELRFGLKPLTARDAWADDMTEMFDFTTPALLTPPPLPAQPTNGACSAALEAAP